MTSSARSGRRPTRAGRWCSSTHRPAASACPPWTATTSGTRWATRWRPRVTAAHLAVSGVLERHPGLRVLLAHGGGALPAVRGRLRRAFAVRGEARERSAAGPDEPQRRVHYDTGTHAPGQLAGLIPSAGDAAGALVSRRP